MQQKGLNRNQLKYLAVVTMLADHVAWAFLPTWSVAGQLMHMVGRFTAPAMLFFLTEGYVHTGNLRRYASRMLLFALLSWVPCCLFEKGYWPFPYFGMLWTMLLGLEGLRIWDQSRMSRSGKVLSIIGLCMMSLLGDWPVLGVLLPLVFFEFRGKEREKWLVYIMICLCFAGTALLLSGRRQLFQFGMLFAPLLLKCYNGERGSGAAFHKWVFYIFYPAHLLLLWWLKTVF